MAASHYTFGTPIAAGSPYAVTVLDQPTGQYCTVSNGTGTVAGSAVTNANVTCVNTYSVGGTLSGLTTGSLVLQDNGGSNLTLTVNGTFSFTTPVADGSNYHVTVLTQPAGQDCTVSAGSGTVGAGNVTTVSVICAGAWTWMSGATTQGSAATYGTEYTPSTSNSPGARYASVTWTDTAGNLWLFGGAGYGGGHNVYFNDLWRYSIASGWAWMGGSATSNLAACLRHARHGRGRQRAGVAQLRRCPGPDSAGNLWLFGGYGYDVNGTLGNLNDLWEFNPTTRSGPGLADRAPRMPTDFTGHWVRPPWQRAGRAKFRGVLDRQLRQLLAVRRQRRGTIRHGRLTQRSVDVQPDARLDVGIRLERPRSSRQLRNPGHAESGNVPGARQFSSGWIDASNNLWVFGGQGYDSAGHFGYMNDLWQYNPTGGTWTWVSGSSTIAALAVYGTIGVAAAGNVPGARDYSNAWIDSPAICGSSAGSRTTRRARKASWTICGCTIRLPAPGPGLPDPRPRM